MAVKHAKLAAVKLLVETYASSDGVNYYHSLVLLNATKVNDVEMVNDSYHADDAFSALKALVTLALRKAAVNGHVAIVLHGLGLRCTRHTAMPSPNASVGKVANMSRFLMGRPFATGVETGSSGCNKALKLIPMGKVATKQE
ncbi:hypothetical protein PC116_g28318 [Phytophthora cactorum]|nr:hypothetical protein PC116_g28318 [Phytophthora cactorum]